MNTSDLLAGPHSRYWIGVAEAYQYVIRRVLYTSIWPVELADCLSSKPAKQITIRDVCHGTKDQLRTHTILARR
jgi:hypothetical protein